MQMKRFIVIILFLSSSILIKAQPHSFDFHNNTQEGQQQQRQERMQAFSPIQDDEIESRKIAFLSTNITLTPAEASRFWPVYNEWNKQLMTNMKARHEAFREIRQLNRDKKTDEKAYARLSQMLVHGSAEEARIISEAHKAYVAIIGEVRTAKLYLAEERFRGMLIRELQQQPPQPPHPPRENP